jgi:hypothetical protein
MENSLERITLFDLILPRVEVAAWLLAVLGVIAKWNLLASSGPLLVIGMLTLSSVFFLQAFAPRSNPDAFAQEAHQRAGKTSPYFTVTDMTRNFFFDAAIPMIVGISMAVAITGILFKLLFLPGSQPLLTVGAATIVLGTILVGLRRQLDRRTLVVGALGTFMLCVPSEALIQQFHRNDPVLVEKMIYQLHHPHDPAASQAVQLHLQQHPIR